MTGLPRRLVSRTPHAAAEAANAALAAVSCETVQAGTRAAWPTRLGWAARINSIHSAIERRIERNVVQNGYARAPLGARLAAPRRRAVDSRAIMHYRRRLAGGASKT